PEGLGRAVAKECAVVTAHEAELLALRGVRRREAPRPGPGADVGLRELADREDGALELELGQRPQEVALVLLEVPAAVADEPAGPAVSRDAGVVPGGHGVRLPRQGTLEERAELHLTVADDAGAGRPAGPILPREVGDDQLRELALVVQEVVGNPELPG